MKPEHLHILRHTIGLSEAGHGRQYRNYYATAPDCYGYSEIQALVAQGLMYRSGNVGAYEAFSVTEAGRAAALKDVTYPKLTRSQRRWQKYRAAHEAFGITFREWLKTEWAKEPV